MKAEIKGENKYNILAIDSTGKIYEFGKTGEITTEIETFGAGFEIWKIGENYLYPHLGPAYNGVCMVDKNGNIIYNYNSNSEVFTCQPLENGFVLVGELTEKRIVILNSKFEIDKTIPIKSNATGHEVMRMARKQEDGTYLVVHPGDCAIRQYDDAGNVLLEIPTYPDTFAAHILPNSNIVYSAQTAIIEVNKSGEIVWKADINDLKEVSPQWLTGLEVLKNGNYLVCNWLGHGREGMGTPLFEINKYKEIVWSLSAENIVKNTANMKIL